MIGPEGGFSKDELKLLESLNATAITLGANILRTEVAAITAVSQLAAIMKWWIDAMKIASFAVNTHRFIGYFFNTIITKAKVF